MAGISRILGIGVGGFIVGLVAYTGPHATDPEGFLGIRGGEGVLQCCGNGGQIAVSRIGPGAGFGQYLTGKPVMGNERTDIALQVGHFGLIVFDLGIGHQIVIVLCVGVSIRIFF